MPGPPIVQLLGSCQVIEILLVGRRLGAKGQKCEYRGRCLSLTSQFPMDESVLVSRYGRLSWMILSISILTMPVFLKILPKDMFLLILESKKGREREIPM